MAPSVVGMQLQLFPTINLCWTHRKQTTLTSSDLLGTDFFRDLFQCTGHLDFGLISQPLRACEGSSLFSRFQPALLFFVSAKFTTTQDVPRSQCKAYTQVSMQSTIIRGDSTFVTSHGDDVALKASVHDIPCTLVDREWCFSMVASILVCFGDDPCWGIGCSLYESLSSLAHTDLRLTHTKYRTFPWVTRLWSPFINSGMEVS